MLFFDRVVIECRCGGGTLSGVGTVVVSVGGGASGAVASEAEATVVLSGDAEATGVTPVVGVEFCTGVACSVSAGAEVAEDGSGASDGGVPELKDVVFSVGDGDCMSGRLGKIVVCGG